MLTFLDTLVGIIAPHECMACGLEGALLCPKCLELLPEEVPKCYRCHSTKAGAETCKSCRKLSPIDNVWVTTAYEAFGRELITKLKFGRAYAAAGIVAAANTNRFYTELSPNVILVPVPTATSRVRQRGYDQSVIITKAMAKYTGLPCVEALVRTGQQRQTGSNRNQRLAQLDNSLQVRSKKLNGATGVVLIDDVLTTGATLETAARTLKKNGVKNISAIVFARSE